MKLVQAIGMTILDRVLDLPSYGFEKNGQFYKPTTSEIFREFGIRMNVFKDRKNWLPCFGWMMTASLSIPFFTFFIKYFSWPLFIAGFFYSMVFMGSHGTFWLHRFGTHRAFRIKNSWFKLLCRNLTFRIIAEETYVISHHVHHQFPEKAGDPYNVKGGFFYCFFADAIHQNIARNLNEKDYEVLCKLVRHTGIRINSYAQYQKWGTLVHPVTTVLHYFANWGFWYAAFYFLGGHGLACALMGSAGVWGFGVRTFNFEGHGAGKDKRQDGIDFGRDDLSVNQVWPGYVAGEWHNNHHLYGNSARTGFLPYQIDLPWYCIRFLEKIGAVNGVKDNKADFLRDYWMPYQQEKLRIKESAA
ncbi:MAG: hypothetical protein JNL01_13545 [Bdellovibrionales bacterium]|nr:hypothetical protein [Bdellovibrionales bacterium]